MGRKRFQLRHAAAPMSIRQRLTWLVLLFAACWLAMPAARAASCAPAATQGTAPNDYQTYCWLDFSGYNDSTVRSGGGQNFSFALPDGSTMSFNLKMTSHTGPTPVLNPVPSPSWSGAAIGNAGFNGIPGSTVLYQLNSGNQAVLRFSNINVVPPTGGTASYALIVADGESTQGTDTITESLKFVTNGSPWTVLANITQPGGYNPPVTGAGTTTITETGTQNVTANSYVFGSFNNPTQMTATINGGGLEGIMIAVRFASVSVTKVISGTRINAADQFTYSVKTSGGTVLASQSTSGSGTSGFTPASLPTIAASYPFVVSEAMKSGSVSSLANYSSSLSCVNNAATPTGTVVPTNLIATSYTFPSLQYGDSIVCTFTNTSGAAVSGTVYGDANHDLNLDNGETGTGVTGLYVKLSPRTGTTCNSPATYAAAVDPGTGNYQVPGVASGNYCLILDSNNTLSDITPAIPAGYIGTEASTGIRQVTTTGSLPLQNQNFGLFNGRTYAGTVFADTGSSGGTANNGVKDGGEVGLAGLTVNAVSGSTTVASAGTDGTGTFILYIPASVSGSLTVTPAAPSGYLATGGSAGTSGGSYTRPSVTFTAGGSNATGLAFGLVPSNTFAPDGAQSTSPGTVVFYPHTYTAQSGGNVSFSTSAVAAPALSGWIETIYRDSNCNGAIDPGEPLLTSTVAATAGQNVCIVVREFVPANAALGAQNAVTVTAVFTYTNAAPALASTLTRTDTTTVDLPGSVKISKLVTNVTQGGSAATSNNAKPGDILRYDLLVTNPAANGITQLVVNDATPAFTVFVSAACPGTLPANLTACAVTTQPSVGGQGSLVWTFTGSMAPGAQLTVSYQVTVSP